MILGALKLRAGLTEHDTTIENDLYLHPLQGTALEALSVQLKTKLTNMLKKFPSRLSQCGQGQVKYSKAAKRGVSLLGCQS